MSLATSDLIAATLADLQAMMDSDVEFADVVTMVEDESNPLYGAKLADACLSSKAGSSKHGIAAIVCQPDARHRDPGVKFGPLEFEFCIWILEDRMSNADTANGGTGIASFNLADHLKNIWQSYAAGGLVQNFTGFTIKSANMEIEFDDKPSSAFKGWAVKCKGPQADYRTHSQVLPAVISPNTGAAPQTVTLTCSTAGASIYYTLDLTHPWSGSVETQGSNLVPGGSTYDGSGNFDVSVTENQRYIVTAGDGTKSIVTPSSSTLTVTGTALGAVTQSVHLAACQLYSGPFTVWTAAVLSARAFKSGSIGSIRTAASFT